MNLLAKIIKDATPGPWVVRGCVVADEAVDFCFSGGRTPVCVTHENPRTPAKANAAFIATFDPEHIALMNSFVDSFQYALDNPERDSDAPYLAHEALMDYRKECGLEVNTDA